MTDKPKNEKDLYPAVMGLLIQIAKCTSEYLTHVDPLGSFHQDTGSITNLLNHPRLDVPACLVWGSECHAHSQVSQHGQVRTPLRKISFLRSGTISRGDPNSIDLYRLLRFHSALTAHLPCKYEKDSSGRDGHCTAQL